MAKKAVATFKKGGIGKDFTKVIRMSKSKKTGAYEFKEDIIVSDMVKEFLKK
ncbi:MAG: DUF4295 domain-containing protein [Bacteroidetes bacterium CG02_land_8_20_14_3_00_31_25]|nr:DUF4295 domain-containing protein [Bacteroidota bacterium]PIV58218.1 MAG: DUF4295 domain-containing protein [Bacteroidetes bacterium CG02_land_8_20_14_3_00_31_25]PIX35584.1 MAG: DUF4295 domain-containing protein [Bacteroidetes bacterium CG_4_8_14_3_um_filter_31_14]PIY04506.1 MAG: DUF4295 domain-containing protein [Bacteroidetes bacterium CG_4_10_14_3_um_filter_31_20]